MNFNDVVNEFNNIFSDKTPTEFDSNFYIQFDLTDVGGQGLTVVIYPGIVEIAPNKFLKKDVYVKCKYAEAIAIATGEIKFSKLADYPEIQVEGDVVQADKLFKSFASRKKLLGL